jgi:hypothetical protein
MIAPVSAESEGFDRPQLSFAYVLAAIIAALIFQLAAPDHEVPRLIAIILQGAVVVLALEAAGASRRVMLPAVGVILVVALAATTSVVVPGDLGVSGPRLGTLVLVLLAPAGIVVGLRRLLRRQQRITIEAVFGGLSLYLLLGMAYSFLYGVIQDLQGSPFFVGRGDGAPEEFLYFSLITLTTTGYGDFTAASDVGRAFAASEALFGQIYLVTIVALLVANLGRDRPIRRQADSS